jgi:hypothetical protein
MAWFPHSCHTARFEVMRGGYIVRVMAAAPVCASSHCSVHHCFPKVQKILYSYVEDCVRPGCKNSEYLCSEDISVHFVTKGVAGTHKLGLGCVTRQKFVSWKVVLRIIFGKGPYPIFWAVLWAAGGQVIISSIPNCLTFWHRSFTFKF